MIKDRSDRQRKNKGMTLEEIRYRQLITRVKIDMTRQQIRTYIDASLNHGSSAQAIRLVSNWERIKQWAEYGMIGYRAYRHLRSLFNGSRK